MSEEEFDNSEYSNESNQSSEDPKHKNVTSQFIDEEKNIFNEISY